MRLVRGHEIASAPLARACNLGLGTLPFPKCWQPNGTCPGVRRSDLGWDQTLLSCDPLGQLDE